MARACVAEPPEPFMVAPATRPAAPAGVPMLSRPTMTRPRQSGMPNVVDPSPAPKLVPHKAKSAAKVARLWFDPSRRSHRVGAAAIAHIMMAPMGAMSPKRESVPPRGLRGAGTERPQAGGTGGAILVGWRDLRVGEDAVRDLVRGRHSTGGDLARDDAAARELGGADDAGAEHGARGDRPVGDDAPADRAAGDAEDVAVGALGDALEGAAGGGDEDVLGGGDLAGGLRRRVHEVGERDRVDGVLDGGVVAVTDRRRAGVAARGDGDVGAGARRAQHDLFGGVAAVDRDDERQRRARSASCRTGWS